MLVVVMTVLTKLGFLEVRIKPQMNLIKSNEPKEFVCRI